LRWLEDGAEHLKSETGSQIVGEDVFVQFYSESTVPFKMIEFIDKYKNGRTNIKTEVSRRFCKAVFMPVFAPNMSLAGKIRILL
jgi:hypothetical protein